MTTDKPDLTRVWGNGAPSGNIVDPDMTTPGKVNVGWQAEVPPFEHFNFLQKWFSQGLAHFNEQGIGVWDTDTTYPINGMAKGSDGLTYRAKLEQSRNDPVSDDGTNWEPSITIELVGVNGGTSNRPLNEVLGNVANVKDYGAVGDGVADDTVAIQAAISNSLNLPAYLPAGKYRITDELIVGARSRALMGDTPIMRNDSYSVNTVIIWDGGVEPKKTMVQLGQNKVGAEPSIDSTANQLRNVYLVGNNQVGFLCYGTYLTNDSWVSGVGGQGSTEYNFYFARGWYASFENITSKACKNVGIALGMPLVYSNGTEESWTTPAPLELNQCYTNNIRSHSSGQKFSQDAPGTFDPTNPAMRRQGYGIGAGIGNGFRLDNFLAEASGGVNLYTYTDSQPSKYIGRGYIENSCLNAGLDPSTTTVNMMVESEEISGGGYRFEHLFCSYKSGGIMHVLSDGVTFTNIKYQFENIFQPRFLKFINWDGTVADDDSNIFMENCYFHMAFYNKTDRDGGRLLTIKPVIVNTRYGWTYDLPTEQAIDLWAKRVDGTYQDIGSIVYRDYEGNTITSHALPPVADLPLNEWVRIRAGLVGVSEITKGGSSPTSNSTLHLMVRLPKTTQV